MSFYLNPESLILNLTGRSDIQPSTSSKIYKKTKFTADFYSLLSFYGHFFKIFNMALPKVLLNKGKQMF